MRALTIQQPYPHLIVTPQSELPPGAFQKRVENRVWECKIRETIAIHAGLSMRWFAFDDYPCSDGKLKQEMFPEMSFGAFVGLATISACFHEEDFLDDKLPADMQWLKTHAHVSGPYCFVFSEVWRLKTPIPCTGKLGLWTVPDEIECQFETDNLIPVPFTFI